jgi:hypothetical protein
MTQYDNTNRGTISKNTRKEQDSHPDIAGSINVAGVDYWINGWQKTNSQDGSKFYSLTVKPKQERSQEIRNQHEQRDQRGGGYANDMDDDLHF